MMTLNEWAAAHNISPMAMDSLRRDVFGHESAVTSTNKRGVPGSEAYVQGAARLAAARVRDHAGRPRIITFRNNNGGFKDPDTGRAVRYGLANESHGENERIKSSDLICIERVRITQAMVGTDIGQFVAAEAKEAGWKFNPNDEHEAAQQRFNELVISYGGKAFFFNHPDVWGPSLPPLPKL